MDRTVDHEGEDSDYERFCLDAEQLATELYVGNSTNSEAHAAIERWMVRTPWGARIDVPAEARRLWGAAKQRVQVERRRARREGRGGGDRFFGRDGLLAQTLAREVREDVTVGRLVMHRDADANDALWHCDEGVWRPGAVKEVERACSDLLGERLRKEYVSNALLALRTSDLPVVPDGPPHPEFLHFENGFLRWATDEFYPHPTYQDPAMLSTVQLAVPWDPAATCPGYDAWVAQVLPKVGSAYVDELTGYLLLNGNPLHKAFLLLGRGRNGKGTYLRLHTALLGARNCASVPLQTLTENRFAPAELHMKLANVAGDLDSRYVEQTNLFKMVTGQDAIYAERKNGQPFRFTPWAVPIFSANTVPASSDTSAGYLSRWEVVPFSVQLDALPGGIDPDVEARIRNSELPGIARRGVEGLRRLLARGSFDRPKVVKEAFEEFERRLDQVRAWVADRCEWDGEATTYRTDLYSDYQVWAAQHSHKALSAGKFYERVEHAGFDQERKDGGRRHFVGLRLLSPTFDPVMATGAPASTKLAPPQL